MRKYIHVAKALKPSLTQPACELLAEEYAKLRSHDNMTQDNVAKVGTRVYQYVLNRAHLFKANDVVNDSLKFTSSDTKYAEIFC